MNRAEERERVLANIARWKATWDLLNSLFEKARVKLKAANGERILGISTWCDSGTM